MVNVGVLGSGPCGLLSALILLRKGVPVTILDIGSFEETPINDIRKLKFLKTFENLNYFYDINQFEKIFTNFNRKFFSSKAFLGFSKIWGGTWEPNSEPVNHEWEEAFVYLDSMVYNDNSKFLNENQSDCKCFDKNFNRYQKSFVKNFELKKTINLFQELKTLNVEEQEIWNAEVLFNECLLYENFNYVDNFHLNKLIISESGLKAISFQNVELNFDKIILAGGPISNSTIILRSNLSNEIILNDTKLCYVPYFNFIKQNKHSKEIFWSRYSAKITLDNDLKFFIQIHTDVANAILRLTRFNSKTIKLMVSFFSKIITKRVGVMLVYFDYTISDRIKITFKNNRIIATKISKLRYLPTYKIIFETIKKFFKLGIIPLWIFGKITSVGESYHLGKAEGVEFGYDGNLVLNKNIFVVGSFSLKKLDPGPITKSAMAQTYIATKNLLKSINLE